MEKYSRMEKAAATKEKVFSTAVGLIKEKGYAHVTVSEICRTAGIAKGTFYVHYASKEDIVRESYYGDMGRFVRQGWNEFLERFPGRPAQERVLRFLLLELEFAEYAGYELTCLAYFLNLGACVPGPSEHLQKRAFSQTLHQEISDHIDETRTRLSADGIFTYLESVVRGVMATWCFSNGSFSLKDEGADYLKCAVESIFPTSGGGLPAFR